VSVAFIIKHAKRMHLIVLPSVACTTLECFSTLHHKQNEFRGKKVNEHAILFLFSLEVLSETFLTLRRSERDIINNVHKCLRNVAIILVRF